MLITIGAELEGWSVDQGGSRVNTLDAIGGISIQTGIPFEMVTPDMAADSIELVTGICANSTEVLESFRRLQRLMPEDLKPVFAPTLGPVEVVNKSRARAMMSALGQEREGGARGVSTVAEWASFQTQIGIADRLMTPEGVFFLDLLNNIAPFARQKVIGRYGVDGDEQHFMCWQGWCMPERVPSPRWFGTPEVLQHFVSGVPKLVTKSDGEWIVAQGTPSRLGDPESEGTLWWAARPRCFNGIWTVEWRMFPSLSPEDAADLSGDVLMLAQMFWAIVGENPGVDWTRLSMRKFMYERLIRSELVPHAPLSDEDWWRLYRL